MTNDLGGMNQRGARAIILLGLLSAFFASSAVFAQEGLAPIALSASKDAHTAYIAEYAAKQIAAFNLESNSVTATLAIPDSPTGASLSSDGSRLYVTCGSSKGCVCVIDLGTWTIAQTIAVGHTPYSPAAHPDGKTLFVCNRFNNDVSVVDLEQGKEVSRIPMTREPIAAVLSPDGGRLFVANHLPAGPSDGDSISAVVTAVDAASKQVLASIPLPNGSSSLHGICSSPDGAFIYVTHLLSRYQMPTTQLERGWMNTNALSIIDAKENKLVNTVLLDDVDLGAANPWGVACSEDGKYICVAHAGSHEISVIDRAGLHDRLASVASGKAVTEVSQTPADVPNDLAFTVRLRRRIALPGNGPRGIIVIGSKVYAAEYFSDTIAAADIDANSQSAPQALVLGASTPLSQERKGEMLFNDAALCFQHWQSCASCHPDARVDGLNWDLMNDGLGNPKNTKSMLLSHQTPPSMSLGIRKTAEAAVRAGIKHIQFSVRPEEDAVAIDEYLKALKPVPSPYLVDGKLSPAAERGKAVFDKAGCSKCHPQPLYTDLALYDVGTGKDIDKDKKFDTPTLVEIWRTAPYLHDGGASAISNVLKELNANDAHGATSSLTQEEINDLAEFVLSN
jgi:YVTN family beta-propeller protein